MTNNTPQIVSQPTRSEEINSDGQVYATTIRCNILVDGVAYRVSRRITKTHLTTRAWVYLDWDHTPAPEHIQDIARKLSL